MENILVIDDDVEMCGMLAEYLQSEGLQVETVHNGEDGLKRAFSRPDQRLCWFRVPFGDLLIVSKDQQIFTELKTTLYA